ncbi:type 1 glutamine amidotransferase [Granulicoccus phenolivorans]|uniref:type 1 glutamine amidotransferase n=1 Tax=Granulicoccus phenolivorans TaxID=266854 RepID=UPI000400D424|nr:type 1 glutamine amidotransferase [Granulicoccus phenolivorans]
MPRVTVLQLDARVPIDRLAGWLKDLRVGCSLIPLYEKPVPPLGSVGDGLIILGGRMSVREPQPWSAAVADLIADLHSVQVPILGICLGHQLLAEVLGGEVSVGADAGPEDGPVEIEWLAAAAEDPVLGPVAAGGPALFAESHHDVVSVLPPGATELARSKKYPNQAFRLGSALGVQFHPEASPELVGKWADQDGQNGRELVRRLREVDDRVAANSRAVIAAFAEQVR